MQRPCIYAGLVALFALTALTLAGCQPPGGGPPQGKGPPTPEVFYVRPTVKQVTDYQDFPGRTEAIEMVDVRSRVTAPLQKIHFTDGARVKKGQLLFELDPSTFQAVVNGSKAGLEQAKARNERLRGDYQRGIMLRQSRSISEEEFAKLSGEYSESTKAIDKARADLDTASLALSFAKIEAPLSGQISRHYIDVGNTVKADDTVLATIVADDDIFVYFDLDQRSARELRDLILTSKMPDPRQKTMPVLAGLPSEQGYPREGVVDYADNRVDAGTGTWRLRGRFNNKDQRLSAGLYVRVRLPLGKPHEAILVPEKSLSTDQGNKFVYVISPDNKVISRPVEVGRIHDGMRAITKGVAPEDRVLVSGLQRVRPQDTVVAKEYKAEEKKAEEKKDSK